MKYCKKGYGGVLRAFAFIRTHCLSSALEMELSAPFIVLVITCLPVPALSLAELSYTVGPPEFRAYGASWTL